MKPQYIQSTQPQFVDPRYPPPGSYALLREYLERRFLERYGIGAYRHSDGYWMVRNPDYRVEPGDMGYVR